MKETLAGISGGQRDKRHDIAQPERKRTGFTPPLGHGWTTRIHAHGTTAWIPHHN